MVLCVESFSELNPPRLADLVTGGRWMESLEPRNANGLPTQC